MTLNQSDLAQFIGTTTYYQHRPFRNFYYTDGVKYVAEQGQAYWLLDAIASYQPDPRVKNDPMLQEIQFWKLQVKDKAGTLICARDSDDMVLTQEIPYTDFPLSEIRFYFQQGVLMLPSEY
jgi:hypothetical protein